MISNDRPELDELDMRGMLGLYGVLWLCDFAILFNGHPGGFALFSTMLLAMWVSCWKHPSQPLPRSRTSPPAQEPASMPHGEPGFAPGQAEALTNARGLAKGLSAIFAAMLVLSLLV